MEHLSPQLKALVDEAVSLLGEVIRREAGNATFERIESLRGRMANLRGKEFTAKRRALAAELGRLEKLPAEDRREIALAFTLMLELMNSCENAYRAHSIRHRALPKGRGRPDAVIYVLTAHPTEARSPQNIWIFERLQAGFTEVLESARGGFSSREREEFLHLIALAWKCAPFRGRKPRVHDEAEHVYAMLLREDILRTLLEVGQELAPVYVRSWVGGDKDGHPGVDERAMTDSLQVSRSGILRFARARLQECGHSLRMAKGSAALLHVWKAAEEALAELRVLRAGDAARVARFRRSLAVLTQAYERELRVPHPGLSELRQLGRLFPAYVVPLELRESSDVLMSGKRGLAITRMLARLAALARGGDPRWYARGLIISMAQSIEHIRAAARLVRGELGEIRIPIIPLFEQAEALREAPAIVREMLRDAALKKARERYWQGYLELMVGYSDSSKESGVLASRCELAKAMHELDSLCAREKVTPIFFQGSGGSVDRGGGTVDEQTAWWPAGALRNYKVTVQGEMVERSLAGPEIARRQLERIVASAGRWREAGRRRDPISPAVARFAENCARHYRSELGKASFLSLVEHATPYPYLNQLRIGSRPAKRAKALSIAGLRAIPWVLCWTQSRVLFPTWWGAGSAWAEASAGERKALKRAFSRDPVFSVYVRALGFTLAKVELAVWSLYLDKSALSGEERAQALEAFRHEERLVREFYHFVSGTSRLLEAKPWLFESIQLRAPMIHPLNLLQILALQEHDLELLRLTVTGISSGMMTTG